MTERTNYSEATQNFGHIKRRNEMLVEARLLLKNMKQTYPEVRSLTLYLAEPMGYSTLRVYLTKADFNSDTLTPAPTQDVVSTSNDDLIEVTDALLAPLKRNVREEQNPT